MIWLSAKEIILKFKFSLSFGQTAIFLIGGTTKEEKPCAMFLESGDVLVMSQESRLCYHAVPRVMKARQETWNILEVHKELPEELKNIETASQPSKKMRTDVAYISNNEMETALEWSMDAVLYQQVSNDLYWTPFKSYLHDSRININVRQVLNSQDSSLNSF